jgi:hypothetical protein
VPPSSVAYTTDVPFDCRTKPFVPAARTVAAPVPLPTRIAPVVMVDRPSPPEATPSGVERVRVFAVIPTASVEFAVRVTLVAFETKPPEVKNACNVAVV